MVGGGLVGVTKEDSNHKILREKLEILMQSLLQVIAEAWPPRVRRICHARALLIERIQ